MPVFSCLWIALWVAFSASASGQEIPAVKISAEKAVVFRMLIGSDAVTGLAFCNLGMGDHSVRVKAMSYRRSPFYSYEGSSTLLFYAVPEDGGRIITREEATLAAANGVELEATEVVASVNLEGAPSSHVLLLFSVDTKAPGKYIVQVVDESPKKFPVETVRLVNLSNDRYFANINGGKTTIPPGETKDVVPEGRLSNGGILVRLGLERQNKIGAVLSRSFSFREGNRALVFIRPGERDPELPSISTIKDNPVLVNQHLAYLEKLKSAQQGGSQEGSPQASSTSSTPE